MAQLVKTERNTTIPRNVIVLHEFKKFRIQFEQKSLRV